MVVVHGDRECCVTTPDPNDRFMAFFNGGVIDPKHLLSGMILQAIRNPTQTANNKEGLVTSELVTQGYYPRTPGSNP